MASIWELAIKAALGRADFHVDPGKVAEAALETGFAELAVTAEHACVVAGLPMHHRDPFDRLPMAQALALPARLLTADARCGRIWSWFGGAERELGEASGSFLKKTKRLLSPGCGSPLRVSGRAEAAGTAQRTKVFCFFFSKKKASLAAVPT